MSVSVEVQALVGPDCSPRGLAIPREQAVLAADPFTG
jgi:hypothetical protein